ncbi:MAG: TetR/AcrR family transcriptional regulator [Thermoplasmata archaeon]|nr:TetR/AcrR family transcriptional regulator [Thermoplasmata archaeon]
MPKVVAGYKDQARERIVDAAQTVFHRKGLSRSTMEDIAQEIGVSKGALYVYFRTKTELLVALQSRQRERAMRDMEEALGDGDVAEGIASSLDRIFSGDHDAAVWLDVATAASSDPEIRAVLELDAREDAKIFRKFLKRLEDRGRIPKLENREVAADIILSLLMGTLFRVGLGGSKSDARRKLVRALRSVLHT